ncbi:hypothetical protein PP590_gp45 [Pseudoalteromonas phage HS1]|nr:hypothetical protein PP590_gp45 [Pseudoalteromonas phage HS1]
MKSIKNSDLQVSVFKFSLLFVVGYLNKFDKGGGMLNKIFNKSY